MLNNWLNDIEFANSNIFYLLLLLPLLAVWHFWKLKKYHAPLTFSTILWIKPNKKPFKYYLKYAVVTFRLLALGLFITALARPQSSSSWQNINTEGIDIVIALDISGSMLAEDLKPNRLEASKQVAIDFISNRINDRMGLVVFSGESFTQCPLTTDHDVLKNLFKDIKNGMIEDGTAIGSGLATAVTRLKDSEAKSKVVILLTDGFNTSGSIPPLTAAEIAQAFNVRVYTIGVGTNGMAPYPFRSPFGGIQYQQVEVKIDEPTLTQIADKTGGKYFRAFNNQKLIDIYKEIDQLEKSKIEVTEYRKKSEEFLPWLIAGSIFLLLEFLLKNITLKSIV